MKLPTDKVDPRPPIIRFFFRLRIFLRFLGAYAKYMTHFKCPHVWGLGRSCVDEEKYFKTCIYCNKRKYIKEFNWRDNSLD